MVFPRVQSASGPVASRGPNSDDVSFDLVVSTEDEDQAAPPGEPDDQTTVDDCIWDTYDEQAILTFKRPSITNVSGAFMQMFDPVVWESSDENVGYFDSTGTFVARAAGTTIVTASDRCGWVRKSATITVTSSNGEAVVLVRFVEGTAGYAFTNLLTSLLDGEPDTIIPLYSNNAQGILNENCFLHGRRPTFVSWKSNAGLIAPGTLITPKHFVCAHHFRPSGTIWFIDDAGEKFSATVQSITRIGLNDMAVGRLSEAMPESIGFAKLFPAGFFHQYLPSLPSGRLSLITVDQTKRANIMGLTASSEDTWPGSYVFWNAPAIRGHLSYYEDLVPYDSGSPMLAYDGTDWVVLSSAYSSGGGPDYTYYLDEIASVLLGWGDGYALTQYDPSGLTSFS